MIEAVVLAFALAMDAAAVSAARGLVRRRGELVVLPLLFGVAQAAMAAIGWGLGAWGGKFVERWDHWIAFALLVLIGGKMLYEAWRADDDEPREGGIALYALLAIATSIDAFAAGVTLPLVPVAPWISIVLIGAITFACSFAAYLAGSAVGGRKLEALGGVILVGLGVKILAEHL